MKKIIITFVSIVLLISFAGCNHPNADRKDTEPSETVEKTTPSGTWSEWIGKINNVYNREGTLMSAFDSQNNGDVNKLIPYNHGKFYLNSAGRFGVDKLISAQLINLQEFNRACPVEIVKKIDDDHIFVIYNLVDEEIGNSLVYYIFERNVRYLDSFEGDSSAAGNYERWEKTNEYYFVTSQRSSEDYANINIGDNAEDVAEFEPAVRYDAQDTKFPSLEELNHPMFDSYRILSDGYMVLTFEVKNDITDSKLPPISEYVLTSKTFYPFSSESFPDNMSINDASLLVFQNNK